MRTATRSSIIFLLFLIMIQPTQSVWTTADLMGRDGRVPKTNWYTVEDWEVGICLKHGGLNDPEFTEFGTMAGSNASLQHNMILTIQAERDDITPSFDEQDMTDQTKKVYEVAWFVQPLEGEDVTYDVALVTATGSKYAVDSGSANFYNPGRGYYAIESEIDYAKATLAYSTQSGSETIEVPIIGANITE